jgi:hypothetical protein
LEIKCQESCNAILGIKAKRARVKGELTPSILALFVITDDLMPFASQISHHELASP